MAGVGRRRLAALFQYQLSHPFSTSVGSMESRLAGTSWGFPGPVVGAMHAAETLLPPLGQALASVARVMTTTTRPQPPFGGFEWATRKVHEKRMTTKYLTTTEFMKVWNDANLSQENGERLTKELMRRGVVMKLGNTVFLDGESVVRAVDDGVPDCPLEVQEKLQSLEGELEPLEKLKKELDRLAFARSKRLLVGGLVGMILQFVVFSRLTFWDSSWDVMEPITYFTTLALTMGAYLFFLKTKQKFRYRNVYNTVGDLNAQRLYERHKLDYEKYKRLKGEVERWRKYSSLK